MAIITLRFIDHAKNLLVYAQKKQKESDPLHAERCSEDPEQAAETFKATREVLGKTRGAEAIRIEQSWSPKESQRLTPEQVNEMGCELAEKYFSGFQYHVVTHTDTPHLHNHIIVNPVHPETGKRIYDKTVHKEKLKDINDDICRARGLSTPNRSARNQDLMQKIDLARSYAQNYEEFAGYLSGFDISVTLNNKNISYKYPNMKRKRRGANLGKKYDKEYLESSFKKNHDTFNSKPDLKAALETQYNQAKGKYQAAKNEFKNVNHTDKRLPVEKELGSTLVPWKEIFKAKNVDIKEYCRRNNLSLSTNAKGETIFAGREHVVITSNYSWKNTRSGTSGSLVELVAAHNDLTLLQSVAKINNNPRLLLLEKHLGKVERKYSPYYPKKRGDRNPRSWNIKPEQRMAPKESVTHLTNFLKSFGGHDKMAKKLLHTGQLQARKDGIIRLLSDDKDREAAMEFFQDSAGNWSKTNKGNSWNRLYAASGGKTATIYTDPFLFLMSGGYQLLGGKSAGRGLLCLFQRSEEAVDRYLVENPKTKKIILLSDLGSKRAVDLDFFENLKRRYRDHDITLASEKADHQRIRLGIELSR